jgi:superfamily II DNA or RNA helicase
MKELTDMTQIEVTNIINLWNHPATFGEAVRERLTFVNPLWEENERMHRWNGSTPAKLRYYKQDNGALILPRGFIRHLIGMAKREGIEYRVHDHRLVKDPIAFDFTGNLKPFQHDAVNDLLKNDFGTLSAPTGSGKTVIALAMIAERQQPALIIVHTKELLNQWADRISQFLDIPKAEIGIIGNGKKKLGEKITVAIVNSVYPIADTIKDSIGHLIIDECHRTPSRTFTDAVQAFPCKYVLGLTATPYRNDGLTRLIFWFVGDVQHSIDKAKLTASGDVLNAEVIIRETEFDTGLDPSTQYTQMLAELCEDEKRNRLIVNDVVNEAAQNGGICLVLSDRKTHCEAIREGLERRGIMAGLLTGDLSDKERKAIVDKMNAGEIKVVCATGQLIGEGFDCKALSTLFLATPIRFDGRLIQYLGRVLRPAAGKTKARIFDYVDGKIGVLQSGAKARGRAYQKQSIKRNGSVHVCKKPAAGRFIATKSSKKKGMAVIKKGGHKIKVIDGSVKKRKG